MLQSHWDQETTATASLERELNNAHIVIVLWLAQPSKLQKLEFRANHQNTSPTPNGAVLSAIGRFTALTELYLCNLTWKKGAFR